MSNLSIEELELAIRKSGSNLSVEYLSRHLQHQSVQQLNWDEKLQEAQAVLSSCVVGILKDWNTSAMMLALRPPSRGSKVLWAQPQRRMLQEMVRSTRE